MPRDELGNDWEYKGGTFFYEFQGEVPPRRRSWPPPREEIFAAQRLWILKVLKGRKYHAGLRSLRFESNKIIAQEVPAFIKTPPGTPSPVWKVQVSFDINGKIIGVRNQAVPMPIVVRQYQKLLHKYRKTLRKDKIKGYRTNRFFIRFGPWSGASKFGLGTGGEIEERNDWDDLGKNYEAGTSVYFTERQKEGKGWVLLGPNRREALHSVGSDYWDDMLSRALKNRKILLVKGDLIVMEDAEGRKEMIYGSDGEPLLDPDSIKVVKKLSPWEVFQSQMGPPIKVKYNWR